MERTITVDGKQVRLKTNAGLLRRYRQQVGRDLVADVDRIMSAMQEHVGMDGVVMFSSLPVEILTAFEDIAYAMNKYGDPDGVPDNIDDWLDGFETFDIYTVFPELIDLWNADNTTTSQAKKNNEKPQEK